MKTILRGSILFFLFVFSLPGFLRATDIDSLKIEPLRNKAGQSSIYVLQFSLADTVSVTAQWKITFPAGFNLGKVKMAGSNNIKGGFTTLVNGSDVIISRTGRGAALEAGRMYRIMLANVTNASSGTYEISVSASDKKGDPPGAVKSATVVILP